MVGVFNAGGETQSPDLPRGLWRVKLLELSILQPHGRTLYDTR